MKKSPIIKDLEKFGYLVIDFSGDPDKGYLCLHDRRQKSRYQNTPFVGKIEIKESTIIYNSQEFKTVSKLNQSIEDYNKTLMFPSEFYDPTYREDYRLEMMLRYYIIDILGCHKISDTSADVLRNRFCIKGFLDEPIFKFEFIIAENSTNGRFLKFHSGNSNIYSEYNFDGIDNAIEVCNGFLSTFILHNSVSSIQILDKFKGNTIISEDTKLNYYDPKSMSSYTVPLKKTIKEKLENLLKALE